jgi:predicted RNA-binding Zn-ribbon protein involved in translation (DUF1610 family)
MANKMTENREVAGQNINKRALLKKCPNCGKRFDVEHTGETVESKKELVPEEVVVIPPTIVAGATPIAVANTLANNPPTIRRETLVQEDEYTESYTCKHCGHVWTETHEKVKDLGQTQARED